MSLVTLEQFMLTNGCNTAAETQDSTDQRDWCQTPPSAAAHNVTYIKVNSAFHPSEVGKLNIGLPGCS